MMLLELHNLNSKKWDEKITVKYEQERIWQDVVMDYFRMLSWHLPEQTEENHENLGEVSQ
jgi:hypothetical protein